MRILIRADASLSIGAGHVARCLALAQLLRKHGVDVHFACRQLPGNLLQQLADQGYKTYELPGLYPDETPGPDTQATLSWQADIAALTRQLVDQPPFDWLIVDHYKLDVRWEQAARRFADRLMAVDDLADRPHAVNLLLDQNYSAQVLPRCYDGLLSDDCRSLFGPRYALLREEFECSSLGEESPAIKPTVERVLVNFGGFDAAGQVYFTMQALQEFDELEVDFVAGTDNPHWAAMSALVQGRARWRLHASVSQFSTLMRKADLFIGAGGGTTWERAALGVPSICISVAPNQQLNARLLAQDGAHLYLGPHDQLEPRQVTQAVAMLCDNIWLRRSFARCSRRLVDGHGARRIAAALLAPLMSMRLATLADAELLFNGRNSPEVRRRSFSSDPVTWSDHINWFERSVQDHNRLLLIGETALGCAGVVRYDRNEAGDCVEVSIYLFEGQAGVGWGQTLLHSSERFLRKHWPQVSLIRALVKPDNAPSLALFHKAGYVQGPTHFQREFNDE